MFPVYALENILLFPIKLIKGALLFIWHLPASIIGHYGNIIKRIFSYVTNIFWPNDNYDIPNGYYDSPISHRYDVKMDDRTKKGAKHRMFEEKIEYVLEPSEVEYGHKVGLFKKLWYYVKWTFNTLLWIGTLGHIERAPSYVLPYPAIYRRSVRKVLVDEIAEPVDEYYEHHRPQTRSRRNGSLAPGKHAEMLWLLPLLLLLLLPTLYLGRNLSADYKNATDTGAVHNPIEYITSKFDRDIHLIPEGIKNTSVFQGIKNVIKPFYDIFTTLLGITWNTVRLLGYTIANFLRRFTLGAWKWLGRPITFVLELAKSLLWITLDFALSIIKTIFKYTVYPIFDIASSFYQGFRYGFFNPHDPIVGYTMQH
uniref:Uncharacterized protein n=1 Tax=Acrobeloides nanus TaxID=290746 RepID=A0A914EMZ3_9BILA